MIFFYSLINNKIGRRRKIWGSWLCVLQSSSWMGYVMWW